MHYCWNSNFKNAPSFQNKYRVIFVYFCNFHSKQCRNSLSNDLSKPAWEGLLLSLFLVSVDLVGPTPWSKLSWFGLSLMAKIWRMRPSTAQNPLEFRWGTCWAVRSKKLPKIETFRGGQNIPQLQVLWNHVLLVAFRNFRSPVLGVTTNTPPQKKSQGP